MSTDFIYDTCKRYTFDMVSLSSIGKGSTNFVNEALNFATENKMLREVGTNNSSMALHDMTWFSVWQHRLSVTVIAKELTLTGYVLF